MSASRQPTLLPIFRSHNQLKLLGHLFVNAGLSSSIATLEIETGIPQATISREVARLAESGLLRTESMGRMKLVAANEDSPFFDELRALLMKAAGPGKLLAQRLEKIAGIEAVYIFGSWAKRYGGHTGPPPKDIDVLVIGNADPEKVASACRRVESVTRMEVNPVLLSPKEWRAGKSGFLREIRKSPLVPVLGPPGE